MVIWQENLFLKNRKKINLLIIFLQILYRNVSQTEYEYL